MQFILGSERKFCKREQSSYKWAFKIKLNDLSRIKDTCVLHPNVIFLALNAVIEPASVDAWFGFQVEYIFYPENNSLQNLQGIIIF